MMTLRHQIEYACYRGDEFIAVDTAENLSVITGLNRKTIISYAGRYRRRVAKLHRWIFFRLDDDEVEDDHDAGDGSPDLVSDDRTCK